MDPDKLKDVFRAETVHIEAGRPDGDYGFVKREEPVHQKAARPAASPAAGARRRLAPTPYARGAGPTMPGEAERANQLAPDTLPRMDHPELGIFGAKKPSRHARLRQAARVQGP